MVNTTATKENTAAEPSEEDHGKVDTGTFFPTKGSENSTMKALEADKEAVENDKNAMEMEDIYEMMGGMGVYQWVVFCLTWGVIGAAVDGIYIVFVGGHQEHWCHIDTLANFTHEQQKYIGIPTDSNGDYEECKMFQLNYSHYTIEDLLMWNRSVMVNGSTPTGDCPHGWTFDQSQYRNTLTGRVSF